MAVFECGNYNKIPFRPLREGMKQATIAMGTDDVTVTVTFVESGHEIRPHSHPEPQIALVLSGECDYYVDGVPYHLTEGGYVVVPENVEHYIEVKDQELPCLQMDIFGTPRPEFKKVYTEYLATLGKDE